MLGCGLVLLDCTFLGRRSLLALLLSLIFLVRFFSLTALVALLLLVELLEPLAVALAHLVHDGHEEGITHFEAALLHTEPHNKTQKE